MAETSKPAMPRETSLDGPGRIIYRPEQLHPCPHPSRGTEPVGTAWECDCGDVWMAEYGSLTWRRVKRLRADWLPWWRRLLRRNQVEPVTPKPKPYMKPGTKVLARRHGREILAKVSASGGSTFTVAALDEDDYTVWQDMTFADVTIIES